MIDAIDRDILGFLQNDARATQREIGRAVGLSPNAAAARVTRLRELGVIRGFTIEIDHAALGRQLEASIDVWLNDSRDQDGFLALVRNDDRIVEAFHPTGPLDFRIKARVASTDDLNDLIIRMKDEGGVRQTDTRLILERLETRPEMPART